MPARTTRFHMHGLPTDWTALCAVVLLLGMRHGLDADHLAAIDGLARLSRRGPGGGPARFSGALFSLGHGLVVIAIAAAVGLLNERWLPPPWFNAVGTWVSIGFLVSLAIANLRAVWIAVPGSAVRPVGLKGGLLGRWVRARGPLGTLLVGAVFALSFDTLSQAAFFGVTARQFGGLAPALTLGALFVLGMLVTDGLNGWWVSHLIARTDAIAAAASRVMSVAVAAVSLLVAGVGIARWWSPAAEGWSEGRELGFGVAVVGLVGVSYLVARRLGDRAPALRRPA